MNILHTETLKSWGGQQNKVLKEMLTARDLGHDCFLICNPGSEIARRAKRNGFHVTELSMHKKNFHQTIPFFLKYIREHQIDTVISHGSTDSWIVAVAGNLSRQRPYLLRERHNLFPIKGYLSRLQHRKMFDRILVLGSSVRNYLESIGVASERCFLLPSTVDLDHFVRATPSLRREYHIPEDAVVVGVLTSLIEAKGVFDFFEAVKILLGRYPSLYVVFGGNYSERTRESIERYFEDRPREKARIVWTGFVRDPATVMKDFDIFLFPSHTEGLGTVILEAMAAKLPVIVYDKEPMNILVRTGVNGFTCPFRDHHCLADKAGILIDDPQLRKAMGEKSFEYVRANYSDDTLKRRIHELLESIDA